LPLNCWYYWCCSGWFNLRNWWILQTELLFSLRNNGWLSCCQWFLFLRDYNLWSFWIMIRLLDRLLRWCRWLLICHDLWSRRSCLSGWSHWWYFSERLKRLLVDDLWSLWRWSWLFSLLIGTKLEYSIFNYSHVLIEFSHIPCHFILWLFRLLCLLWAHLLHFLLVRVNL